MAVNKVVKSDGTTLIDITGTTATASDVAQGKVFYAANGTQQTGTAVMGGGSAISVVDTTDSHGGTIRTITAVDLSADTVTAATLLQGYTAHDRLGNAITGTASSGSVSLQTKTNINPSTSSQTITPDSGYDGLASVQINAMPTGTAGTPTATKGTVSNHSVTVTPSVTNSTGYITGGTKTGTAVTVSASELVSGSETKTENGTYDVTNLETLVVNVPTGGGDGKNAQIALGVGRVASSSYAEVSGQSITVGKTGTYDVYWCGWRTSTSGTSGSQLYINGTAYGSAQTSFSSFSNAQTVHLSNVSLTQGQTIAVRARSRNTSYYMYIYNLTIIEA